MNFEFGGFRLDAAQRRLFAPDGSPVDLPSRAFDLLLYMAERPGELLEKSSLLKGVWPSSVVEESNLSQAIFALRRALGDTTSEHLFIVTIPGRGYQFVAPVRIVEPPNPAAEPESAVIAPAMNESPEPASSPPRLRIRLLPALIAAAVLIAVAGTTIWQRAAPSSTVPAQQTVRPAPVSPQSIAVMPFVDLSSAHDMEYFTDGMAVELMNGLANVNSLRVVGRGSAFFFKGKNVDTRTIGEKLRVDSILEGSVRKDGDRILITAQLVRTLDGVSLWSKTYDRRLDNVLDVQGSIAREVVTALSPLVAPSNQDATRLAMAQTKNAQAYNAYLRGVYLERRSSYADLPSARDEFRRAVQLDPEFAIAYARLGRVYANIARTATGDFAENRALAAEALDHALTLDPSLADLWWIRIWPTTLDSMSLALRARTAEQALSANPQDAAPMLMLAGTYLRLGLRNKAFDLYERAYQADPLWPPTVSILAYNEYMSRGNRQRAEQLMNELVPVLINDSRAADLHALMAISEGRALDWDSWAAKSVEVAPRIQPTHGRLALTYGHLGILDAALYHARVSGELNPQGAGGEFNVAHVNLFAGNIEAARNVVERAMATKSDDYLAQLAQAQLQYFTGSCRGAVRSTELARPAFAQPEGSIDLITDVDDVPILVWCLRQSGNTARAKLLTDVFARQFAPPLTPGVFDGVQARVAAAAGDRAGLVTHLRALVDSHSMQFAFVRHEPMIQPYLSDPDVKRLLDLLDARRAEWRQIIPKSSMRVPIPAAPAAPGS